VDWESCKEEARYSSKRGKVTGEHPLVEVVFRVHPKNRNASYADTAKVVQKITAQEHWECFGFGLHDHLKEVSAPDEREGDIKTRTERETEREREKERERERERHTHTHITHMYCAFVCVCAFFVCVRSVCAFFACVQTSF